MPRQGKYRLSALLLAIVAWAPTASADFSKTTPIHHFFNAQLLKPREYQLSVWGTLRLGLLENLELGTNLFLLGDRNEVQMMNLALKHRMFGGANWQTAMSSHSFLMLLDSESDKARAFFSMHGVVTTWTLGDYLAASGGMMDLYLRYHDFSSGDGINGHATGPSAALDLTLGKNWGIQATMVQCLYSVLDINTEIADFNANFDAQSADLKTFRMGFLTATWSLDDVNLELGNIIFGTRRYFYGNLFWRWEGA